MSLYQFFYDVLLNWITKPGTGGVHMMSYLDNKEDMAKVSAGFSERSNGFMIGAIGL